MDKNCQFVILLVIATVAPLNVGAHNRLEKGILKMIEDWSTANSWRIPIDVPSLPLKMAPAHFKNDEFEFSSSEISIYIWDGISVSKLIAVPSTYQTYIEFEIPTVHAYADWYHLTGSTCWICPSIDNEGYFRLKIENFKIIARIDFGARGSDTVIVNFQMSYGYSDIEVTLSGAYGFVQNTVTKKFHKLLKQKKSTIIQHVTNEVTNRTISFLRGHSPDQLVQMISSD